MKFVVGIGNPERKYDGTRHNAGYEVLDGLGLLLGITKDWKEIRKFQALVQEVEGALLIKPLTYVNRSGDSIAGIVREYHPKPEDILVVCDDVNLDFQKLRIRKEGSAGGHHGLESIIAELNSQDFPRLRFGVRNPDMPHDLESFVLEKFSKSEQQVKGELLGKAILICKSWINEGFDAAQKMLSQLQATAGEKEK